MAAALIPVGTFFKLSVLRIEGRSDAACDYVSAVNGTLKGTEVHFGLLSSDLDVQEDCTVATYRAGEEHWHSDAKAASSYVLTELRNILSLTEIEESILTTLMLGECVSEIPDSWHWRQGADYSGELLVDALGDLVGKLIINRSSYPNHEVHIDSNDIFGVSLDDGTGGETPDDDSELVLLG